VHKEHPVEITRAGCQLEGKGRAAVQKYILLNAHPALGVRKGNKDRAVQEPSAKYICHGRARFVCKSIERVILEKLTVAQIVKKVSALYGTLRFITVITRARH
jgi:hypothetical protein